VVTKMLPDFVSWIEETLKSGNTFMISGALQSLTAAFRYGKREDLLRVVDHISPMLPQVKKLGTNNVAVRKLWIKLTQRVGLCYLRPRLASWRYQRGLRVLMSSFPPAASAAPPLRNEQDLNKEQEEGDGEENEEDVPEVIEEVIGVLLESLGDKSTVVRWSAAKGVGRITERLPKYLGDDVVGNTIQLLGDRADSDMWHGACLALAELARRGLLLPARLPEVIPVVLKGLTFDVRSGAHSVGANVRDSACYVAWGTSLPSLPLFRRLLHFSPSNGSLCSGLRAKHLAALRPRARKGPLDYHGV